MAVELATAYVSIVPSFQGLQRNLQHGLNAPLAAAGNQAGQNAGRNAGHRFSGGFSAAAKIGLAGVAGGLAAVFKVGLDEVKDASAGAAQLAAGIKSTGNAAHVTVGGMEALASSIEGYSGQTDDSVVAAEKLLLTFTNIKNQGPNKIFDLATKAAADMAAKMGGDASSQAILLGKALNDPVKGVTALTRVGVSFTKAQRDQIAAMVKTGDTIGAQKIILHELNTEFGGAAKAAGQSLPGQLAIAQRSFEGVAQKIVTSLLPVIQGLTKFLTNTLIPAFDKLVTFVQSHAGAFKVFAAAVLTIWAAFKAVALVQGVIAVFSSIQTAIILTRVRMLELQGTFAASRLGMLLASGLNPALLALTAVGIAVAGAVSGSNDHTAALEREKNEASQLTSTLDENTGALTRRTRAVVQDSLLSNGTLDAARALGVSLNDVTEASLGNAAAKARVTAALKAQVPLYDTLTRLSDDDLKTLKASKSPEDQKAYRVAIITRNVLEQNGALGLSRAAIKSKADADTQAAKAAQGHRQALLALNRANPPLIASTKTLGAVQDNVGRIGRGAYAAYGQAGKAAEKLSVAAAKVGDKFHYVVTAGGNLERTNYKIKGAAQAAATALDKQTTASQKLKTAEDILNGVAQNSELANNTLTISLGGLANKTALFHNANNKVSTSLDKTTVAGATNRTMLVGLVDDAKAAAQATADQAYAHNGKLGPALAKGNAQLKANEDRLRAAAKTAGLDKDETDKLIASVGIVAKLKANPRIILRDYATKSAKDIKAEIDRIKQGKVPGISANTKPGRDLIRTLQRDYINKLRQERKPKIDLDISAALDKINRLAGLASGLGTALAISQGSKQRYPDGKAAGGPVTAGVPYVVGEHRPELFVPNQNGRIIPRVPGGGVSVTQNIYNPVPERASVSGPAGLRRAAYALDRA